MTPLLLPSMIVALLFAAIMAGVFGLALRRPGPWGSTFWMFLVVFMVAWAVGIWMPPMGPRWMGVSWVPFLVAALVATLLVAATARPRPEATSAETTDVTDAKAAAVAAGVLFWAMMILLLVLVITGGLVLSV